MNEEKIEVVKEFVPASGSFMDLEDRCITEKTCRIYGYQVKSVGDKEYQIANYYRGGELIGQHVRGPNKDFKWKGTSKGAELFGQNLWKSAGGKRLVITEGEIDCMTVNQVLGGTWPVVSIPNGAQSAAKAIKDNLEFVNSYSEVVLCFDMDEPGRKAAMEVAELLPPGKCKIVKLPYKDANECLQNAQTKQLVSAIWEAQAYAPDEILHISKIADAVDTLVDTRVYPFPYDGLSEFLIGQRSGEITLWCSGTGSGKSTILRELMHHHLEEDRSVGCIMLEEAPQETMDDMISLMLNKPVRAIRAMRMMNDLRIKMGKKPLNMETMAEFCSAVKGMIRGDTVHYDDEGKDVQLPWADGYEMPVWVAAYGPKALKAAGADDVYCVSVNDAFVMAAWGKDNKAFGKVRMMSDGNADYTKALGVETDLTARGFGVRSQRYSMIVENGVVKAFNLEAAGKFEASSAEKMLEQL